VENPGEAITADTMANGASPAAVMSPTDWALMKGLATMFTDIVVDYSVAAAPHVHEMVPELPQDAECVDSTRRAAWGNAMEVLSMLRAGLPPSAIETPVEALAHARFLQSRGVGLHALVALYQYGFAMFRNVMRSEAVNIPDMGQQLRIGVASDDYFFRYMGKVTARLAAEYGLTEGAWYPTVDDPVLSNPASLEAARLLCENGIAKGAWLPASPEQSRAREGSERALEAFAATIEQGVKAHDLGSRMKLAATTITVTLADESDLSVTLLLDRDPIEVVQGVTDAESRIWIASVDLNRIWLPDFYLPMAITKGRVRIDGEVRKFLRIAPILRVLAGTYRKVVASMQTEEVR
jgi:hypothetical protein